jgi:5-methylcytosine-specific restriction endonuclease McrA
MTRTRVIDRPVLVLNRGWEPVAVFDVATAVTTVVRDMGWVLEPETFQLLDFDTWCKSAPATAVVIPTPSRGVPAPEIIVLKEYGEQPRRHVSFSRQALYRRDGFRCQYCGERPGPEALTIDHVLPRSRGGPTSWENCVAACGTCNRDKADRTPAEAGLRLRTRPVRPRWSPTMRVPHGQFKPSWSSFVGKGGLEVETE